MKTLDDIANQHGTDKGTGHQEPHSYTPYYAMFLEALRDAKLKVLEIGVGNGNSIRMWLDYFPNSEIHGVDISGSPMVFDERYAFSCGDQSSPDFWESFIAQHGGLFDLIVDDGGHFTEQIFTSFIQLWPHMKAGGIYVIEDLEVAYDPVYCAVKAKNQMGHMDFVKDMLDIINKGGDIEWIHFSKGLAIIKKKP